MSRFISIFCVLFAAWGLCAVACERGTVWDAAFHAKRDMHRLCIFANESDEQAAEIQERLARWMESDGKNMNIRLERVNADDPAADWKSYGIPSAPPKLPAVALIGEFPRPKRAFVIDHWEPAPADEELAVLRTSPVREAAASAAVDNWAVILYSASSGGASEAHDTAVANVVKSWNETRPPGVELIRFDRNDPRERILCRFAGITTATPDWVGVVFARGKLMAPPLYGDEITEAAVNELLERLPVPCTCLQDSLTYGLDMPIDWAPALDVKLAAAAPVQEYFEQALPGSVQAIGSSLPNQAPAPAPVASGPALPKHDQHVMGMAIAALTVAASVIIGSAIVVMFRARRRK